MIEIRIVEIGEWCRPELQYRFVLFTADASGSLCPPDPDNMWSDWKVAPYVNLMEIENFYIEQEKEQIKQNLKLSLKNYD